MPARTANWEFQVTNSRGERVRLGYLPLGEHLWEPPAWWIGVEHQGLCDRDCPCGEAELAWALDQLDTTQQRRGAVSAHLRCLQDLLVHRLALTHAEHVAEEADDDAENDEFAGLLSDIAGVVGVAAEDADEDWGEPGPTCVGCLVDPDGHQALLEDAFGELSQDFVAASLHHSFRLRVARNRDESQGSL